jgi:polysaccharide export outer membrane protein
MNKSVVKMKVYPWNRLALLPAALCVVFASSIWGQTQVQTSSAKQGRNETQRQTEQTQVSTVRNSTRSQAATEEERSPNSATGAGAGDTFFAPIYRNFYDTYRLGPNDVLALRVAQQPDYTVERAKVSPVGRVYHPLLGDVEVAGLTVGQVLERFRKDLNEYLLDPKVSIELVEANSAKIGVLGEVRAPMTVMEAITAAGGFADTGSKSNVSLLRPEGGRLVETRVNIKRLLEGKSALEEDLTLRAGDTLIVRGNTRKKIADISMLVGFTQFVGFVTR